MTTIPSPETAFRPPYAGSHDGFFRADLAVELGEQDHQAEDEDDESTASRQDLTSIPGESRQEGES